MLFEGLYAPAPRTRKKRSGVDGRSHPPKVDYWYPAAWSVNNSA